MSDTPPAREFLPCPFCGSTIIGIQARPWVASVAQSQIECANCGVCGANGPCLVDTEDELVAAWNTRQGLPDVTQLRADLDAARAEAKNQRLYVRQMISDECEYEDVLVRAFEATTLRPDECFMSTLVPKIVAELAAAQAEVVRLKRGAFTPEEFQTLCHHRDEKLGCTPLEFAQGCVEYQRLLFGHPSAEARIALALRASEPEGARIAELEADNAILRDAWGLKPTEKVVSSEFGILVVDGPGGQRLRLNPTSDREIALERDIAALRQHIDALTLRAIGLISAQPRTCNKCGADILRELLDDLTPGGASDAP